MSRVMNPPAPFIFMDLRSTTLSRDEEQFLSHRLLAGIVLFARNYESPQQLAQLLADVRAINPHLLFAVDQEGGRVQRFKTPFTLLPAMQSLGNVYLLDEVRGEQLARDCAWLVGSELAAFGIHINFAPVVDIDMGLNQVIGDRAFGKSTRVVTAMTAAYLQGIQETQILPVVKHFPGHGAVALDSHVDQPIDTRPFEVIWESDLRPYRELMNNIPAVMCSHVIYSLVSPMPAGYCHRWLEDVLQRRLGSKAFIFSDDLNMKAAHIAGAPEKRLYLSRVSGCHYALLCNQSTNLWDILEAVEDEIASHEPLMPMNTFVSAVSAPSSVEASLKQWEQLQSFERYVRVREELEKTR